MTTGHLAKLTAVRAPSAFRVTRHFGARGTRLQVTLAVIIEAAIRDLGTELDAGTVTWAGRIVPRAVGDRAVPCARLADHSAARSHATFSGSLERFDL